MPSNGFNRLVNNGSLRDGFIKAVAKVSNIGEPGALQPQTFTSAGWMFSSFAPQFTKLYPKSVKASLPFSRGIRQKVGGGAEGIKKPEQLVHPQGQIPPFKSMDKVKLIVKPVAFTALVGTSSVIGCTIWQYEEYRSQSLSERFSISGLTNRVLGSSDSSMGMRMPIPSRSRNGSVDEMRNQVVSWWKSLSPGERVFWPIFGLNALVWAAWRIPRLTPMMVSYFSASPVGKKICLPMLLSTFSHFSFLHLCANMFVLHSFMPVASQILGKEQFVAMYLTSGTVASLGSHFHKLFIGNCTPSLGASGAILGVLGLVCTRMPDIQLGIIFVPGIRFSADTAIKCVIGIDTAGLLFGWRFMDHAAHLSGTLFGIAFSHWGGQTFWRFRDFVMTEWHKLRTWSEGGSS